ncbi:hypothetical protein Agub_g3719, partial [Astrephomene gubernaculifera]
MSQKAVYFINSGFSGPTSRSSMATRDYMPAARKSPADLHPLASHHSRFVSRSLHCWRVRRCDKQLSSFLLGSVASSTPWPTPSPPSAHLTCSLHNTRCNEFPTNSALGPSGLVSRGHFSATSAHNEQDLQRKRYHFPFTTNAQSSVASFSVTAFSPTSTSFATCLASRTSTRAASATDITATAPSPIQPPPQPPPQGQLPGHSFTLTAADLAAIVSYAFDHDGAMPADVSTSGLLNAVRTSSTQGLRVVTAAEAKTATATAASATEGVGSRSDFSSSSTDSISSLVVEDEAVRRTVYGGNFLPPPHEVTFWELVGEALQDFTVQALLASGLLSLGLAAFNAPPQQPTATATPSLATATAAANPSEWVEGAAILGTVALVVAVSAATGYSKESKFRQLNSMRREEQVRVVRGGAPPTPLPASQLLVGDLVLVEAGDILQADGVLVSGGEIRLDQSHLTGESDDVIRIPETATLIATAAISNSGSTTTASTEATASPPASPAAAPIVFSGSKVLEGYGSMVVLAVGPYSQQGSINAALLSSSSQATGSLLSQPQQRRRRRRHRRSKTGGGVNGRSGVLAAAATAIATVSSVASYDGGSGGGAGIVYNDGLVGGGSDSCTASTTATESLANKSRAPVASASIDDLGAAGEGGGGGGGGVEEGESSGLRAETFLTQKLQVLAQRIGAFGVAAATAVFAVNAIALTSQLAAAGLLLGAGGRGGLSCGSVSCTDVVKAYLDLFVTSITILVVAVPEGLPLAVTLALAFSVHRMLEDRNLVRQLGACETMGAVTTICSDKTGTLTSNAMRVVRLWAAGGSWRVVGSERERTEDVVWRQDDNSSGNRDSSTGPNNMEAPRHNPVARLIPLALPRTDRNQPGDQQQQQRLQLERELPVAVQRLLTQGLVLNSTACLWRNPHTGRISRSSSSNSGSGTVGGRAGDGGGGGGGARGGGGSPTESALLELPYILGWDRRCFALPHPMHGSSDGSSDSNSHVQLHHPTGLGRVIQLLPFSSQRKRMSVVVEVGAAAAAATPAVQPSSTPMLASSSPLSPPLGCNTEHGCHITPGAGAGNCHDEMVAVRVWTKGAAELVMQRCRWRLAAAGTMGAAATGAAATAAAAKGQRPEEEDEMPVISLDEGERERLLQGFTAGGGGSLRVLALAYRDMQLHRQNVRQSLGHAATTVSTATAAGLHVVMPARVDADNRNSNSNVIVGGAVSAAATCAARVSDEGLQQPSTAGSTPMMDADDLEQDFILAALVGLEDPLRPEVPAAVAACTTAGITVRMLTGDNAITAAAIAARARLLPPSVSPFPSPLPSSRQQQEQQERQFDQRPLSSSRSEVGELAAKAG